MARVVEVRVSVIYLSVAKYLYIIYCRKGEGAREIIVATHGECQLQLAADDDSVLLDAYIYIHTPNEFCPFSRTPSTYAMILLRQRIVLVDYYFIFIIFKLLLV